MELLNFNGGYIEFTDGIQTFRFVNLSYYNFSLKENTNNYWMLCNYSKKMKKNDSDNKNLELTINSAFNQNGTYAFISFGYYINKIIRRTLEFDKEGNLDRDYIDIFNYLRESTVRYDAVVLPGTPIKEYLNNKDRIFKNNDCSFTNNILDDSIIIKFFDISEYYSVLFNAFGSNYIKVKEMIEKFEDKHYIEEYRSEAKKVLQKKIK